MNSEAEQSWFALEIAAEADASDAIEHALNEMNTLGTEISHMRKKTDEAITVIGYFDALPDDEILRDELHYALRIYDLNEDAIRNVTRREVVNEDWLSEWKKHWKPTDVGRFVIAPPWENVADDGKIVIRIEPNMAFGTGTHETTRLCLKAIEENFHAGLTFLDVGTGTGILAIAAAKLKPQVSSSKSQVEDLSSATRDLRLGTWDSITGCDTDADSIAIAKENAIMNGVADLIDFRVGPISDTTPIFDFICANLTIDVILPILPLLLEKAGQTLILSGILREQEEMIVTALVETGVKDFSIERLGEWIALTIENGQRTVDN